MAGRGEGSVKASFDALGANAGIAIAKGATELWIGPGAMPSEEYCAVPRKQLKAAPGSELTIDIEPQTIAGPDGKVYSFEIEAFEKKQCARMPWLA